MGSVVVSKRSFSLNALTEHVATDMRPEDSKGGSLARDILCLNVSIGASW